MGPLDEDSAAALGALFLEETRLVASRGGDAESLLRQAVDRLGASVAEVERQAADAGTDLGAMDPQRRLELWRAASLDGTD